GGRREDVLADHELHGEAVGGEVARNVVVEPRSLMGALASEGHGLPHGFLLRTQGDRSRGPCRGFGKRLPSRPGPGTACAVGGWKRPFFCRDSQRSTPTCRFIPNSGAVPRTSA